MSGYNILSSSKQLFITTKKTFYCILLNIKGAGIPQKCNDIVMNFYVQNGSKCNLEYCQHFVASRDLKDFKPMTSLPIF